MKNEVFVKLLMMLKCLLIVIGLVIDLVGDGAADEHGCLFDGFHVSVQQRDGADPALQSGKGIHGKGDHVIVSERVRRGKGKLQKSQVRIGNPEGKALVKRWVKRVRNLLLEPMFGFVDVHSYDFNGVVDI